MNIRNFSLVVMSVMSGFLFSCSDEELIETPDTQQIEGLSVILASKTVQTKAVGAVDNPYKYATPEELQVNTAHVAFFEVGADGTVGNKIGEKNATFSTSNATTSKGDTIAYKIDNISIKDGLGKNVRILAIANSANDYSSYETYDQYKAAIERNLDATYQATATFTATNLVKVGEVDYSFTSSSINPVIEIAMTQLAARVDIKLDIAIPGEELKPDTVWTLNPSIVEGWNKNKVPDNYTNIAKIEDWPDAIKEFNPAEVVYNGKPLIYNEANNGTKLYHVDNSCVITQNFYEWRLDISDIQIYNIETQSYILLSAENVEQKLLSLLLGNLGVKDDGLLLSFYSYEKQFTTKSPLRVNMTGKLIKELKKKATKAKGSWHALWLKNGSSVQPGWGTGGTFAFIPANVTYEEQEPVWTNQIFAELPAGYSFSINPEKNGTTCFTDGVIHGNLYTVTAKITTAQTSLQLEYASVPFGTVPVTIPPFN
ncbi:hypothetical protein DW083_13550 [Parabacteroides sp. AF48-14]|uniref:hypothetical protein n=1 Tax=Parabacteroides sp. AF48-14 TaxID=2292052 RepID=UPI000EFEE6D2|nr:hypothetical protein [Parabacteroides sp. AF48-14]RHO70403.1 hypothetical protein DW083_13550 [Parabacteroides sp. AF48-14]